MTSATGNLWAGYIYRICNSVSQIERLPRQSAIEPDPVRIGFWYPVRRESSAPTTHGASLHRRSRLDPQVLELSVGAYGRDPSLSPFLVSLVPCIYTRRADNGDRRGAPAEEEDEASSLSLGRRQPLESGDVHSTRAPPGIGGLAWRQSALESRPVNASRAASCTRHSCMSVLARCACSRGHRTPGCSAVSHQRAGGVHPPKNAPVTLIYIYIQRIILCKCGN